VDRLQKSTDRYPSSRVLSPSRRTNSPCNNSGGRTSPLGTASRVTSTFHNPWGSFLTYGAKIFGRNLIRILRECWTYVPPDPKFWTSVTATRAWNRSSSPDRGWGRCDLAAIVDSGLAVFRFLLLTLCCYQFSYCCRYPYCCQFISSLLTNCFPW
jgi:hypothetical protein